MTTLHLSAYSKLGRIVCAPFRGERVEFITLTYTDSMIMLEPEKLNKIKILQAGDQNYWPIRNEIDRI
jgi:hypothetical protein